MSQTVQNIDVDSLFKLGQEGKPVDLIDVRTPAEFATVHAAGANNVPLDRLTLSAVQAARQGQPNEPLYLICKSGSRSRTAAEKLLAAGCSNVHSVSGGTVAWERAGLPVEKRGRRVLPLDRQVQLIAGLMVLTGVILALTVHIGWIGLAALVGLGLTVSGSTGFCPMGLLLARMPWNQHKDSCGESGGCCCG